MKTQYPPDIREYFDYFSSYSWDTSL